MSDINKRVEIIVLKYKDPEVEVPCAESIIKNTNWPYKMVFYDTRWEDSNFSRIWNERIKESTCPYFLMIDSDTLVGPGWLDEMMKVFSEHSDISAVVPRTDNCGHGPQVEAVETDGIKEMAMGSGFCWLVDKTIFDKVGYFDEEFGIYGQDSEWFDRAYKMGYKVYLQPKAFVHHIGNYSTKKAAAAGEFDWQSEAKAGGELFKQKTGR